MLRVVIRGLLMETATANIDAGLKQLRFKPNQETHMHKSDNSKSRALLLVVINKHSKHIHGVNRCQGLVVKV